MRQLETVNRKIKAADKELLRLVCDRDSIRADLYGIGSSSAARLLADTGDIQRFRDRGSRFSSAVAVRARTVNLLLPTWTATSGRASRLGYHRATGNQRRYSRATLHR
jgi:hypothetical protein